jgi:hypothetical protein
MSSVIESSEIIENRFRERNSKLIQTKQGVYNLYEQGIFGNKAITWNSLDEIKNSGWKDKVCMRSKRGIARKEVVYNIEINEVPKYIRIWKEKGIPESAIHFNQSMPDEKLILQGEVTRFNCLTLRYSTIKKPMNLALAEEDIEVYNKEAYNLIRGFMDKKSYNNLEELMEIWPESVVEFSSYNIPVGILKLNSVFWEVRNY